MSSTVDIKAEIAAALWLNAQDLSGLSPEDVLRRYDDALKRISEAAKDGKPKQAAYY